MKKRDLNMKVAIMALFSVGAFGSAQSAVLQGQLEKQDEVIDLNPVDIDELGAEELVLTRDDVDDLASSEFVAADKNGDQALSQDEFVISAISTLPPTLPSDKPSEVEDVDAISASEYLRQRFIVIAGGDQLLSKEELQQAAQNDFTRSDINEDDVLSGDEIDRFVAIRKGDTVL